MAKVRAAGDRLKTNVLPRVEVAISKVDQVSADLTRGAKSARTQICSAAERAVNTIRACEQQQLQVVDDFEQIRHKTLDRQKRWPGEARGSSKDGHRVFRKAG